MEERGGCSPERKVVEKMEVEGMSAQRSGGDGSLRRRRRQRRLEDGGVAMTAEKNLWPGQGVAAVVAAAVAAARRRAAAAATAVGLFPRPFVSSHSRWRRLPSFSQMTARVCWGGGGGVPSPLIEPIMGREGKGPT